MRIGLAIRAVLLVRLRRNNREVRHRLLIRTNLNRTFIGMNTAILRRRRDGPIGDQENTSRNTINLRRARIRIKTLSSLGTLMRLFPYTKGTRTRLLRSIYTVRRRIRNLNLERHVRTIRLTIIMTVQLGNVLLVLIRRINYAMKRRVRRTIARNRVGQNVLKSARDNVKTLAHRNDLGRYNTNVNSARLSLNTNLDNRTIISRTTGGLNLIATKKGPRLSINITILVANKRNNVITKRKNRRHLRAGCRELPRATLAVESFRHLKRRVSLVRLRERLTRNRRWKTGTLRLKLMITRALDSTRKNLSGITRRGNRLIGRVHLTTLETNGLLRLLKRTFRAIHATVGNRRRAKSVIQRIMILVSIKTRTNSRSGLAMRHIRVRRRLIRLARRLNRVTKTRHRNSNILTKNRMRQNLTVTRNVRLPIRTMLGLRVLHLHRRLLAVRTRETVTRRAFVRILTTARDGVMPTNLLRVGFPNCMITAKLPITTTSNIRTNNAKIIKNNNKNEAIVDEVRREKQLLRAILRFRHRGFINFVGRVLRHLFVFLVKRDELKVTRNSAARVRELLISYGNRNVLAKHRMRRVELIMLTNDILRPTVHPIQLLCLEKTRLVTVLVRARHVTVARVVLPGRKGHNEVRLVVKRLTVRRRTPISKLAKHQSELMLRIGNVRTFLLCLRNRNYVNASTLRRRHVGTILLRLFNTLGNDIGDTRHGKHVLRSLVTIGIIAMRVRVPNTFIIRRLVNHYLLILLIFCFFLIINVLVIHMFHVRHVIMVLNRTRKRERSRGRRCRRRNRRALHHLRMGLPSLSTSLSS